ncbi:hypothetical protein KJ708_10980 [bacterium]|nr:hypothetical protein [bacterium]MBU1918514.1 hypothetical protein [bacterium]
MRQLTIYFIFVLTILITSCGGGSSAGGTETGSTNSGVDTATLATNFQTVAYELVPEISSALVDASLTADLKYVTYGDSDLWSDYLDGNNAYVITDIFGSSDEEPQVVTKIRVLLDSFEGTMSEIFDMDPDMDCSTTAELNEGDTIEVAYYGEIDNGTSDDRYFDCVYEYTSDGDEDSGIISYDSVTIYGQDSDGVVRIANMIDSSHETPNYTETRGNTQNILSVIMATYYEDKAPTSSSLKYADDEEEDTVASIAYLDLQYNQATLYVGVDETADTADDVYFKSRSRITGRVELDAEGKTMDGVGDFSVIKYDRSINDDDSVWSGSTATMGRGGYSDDEYAIFKVSTDMVNIDASTGDDYFCLEGSESELPSPAAESNCTDYETAYAWGNATFPFTLSPEIAADFETKEYFDTDDLIASDGSDFEMPTYE